MAHPLRKRIDSAVPPAILLLGLVGSLALSGRDAPLPAATQECVDINRASSSELQRIIHVGPARAEQIMRLRPFRSVGDLVRVSGIASARLADIRAQGFACVQEAPEPAPVAPAGGQQVTGRAALVEVLRQLMEAPEATAPEALAEEVWPYFRAAVAGALAEEGWTGLLESR